MATIFCFTSTGNSLYTAKKLVDKIGGSILPMNHNINQTMNHDTNHDRITCEDDVIGFVFPVYFWGLPRMVERFVSNMEFADKNAYVFAVITCGGPVFGVLGGLQKLLQAKGICLQHGTRLISVSNYLPEYTAKDSDTLRKRIDTSISRIADAVNNRESNRISGFTFLNKIIYGAYPNEQSDRHFSIGNTCTGCETCQKVCPAKNIMMQDGKPEFHHRCEHCLSCLHNCPSHAIDWKKKTQGKERYRNAGITLDDLITFNK